ncbi:MAG: hypothetical protein ABWY78_16330 [Microvirga sp.]
MLSQTVMAIVIAGNAALSGLTSHAPARDREPPEAAPVVEEARYVPLAREVSNWRSEATEALNPKPVAVLAALFGLGRPIVGRCVRLNNYWCIKSARWNGEIGTDPEGHVGFASAEEGAAAAAVLLRRYYLDFGRKSALDIVRRWAPAECGLFTGISGLTLAVRGIGGTVRARYLAAHRVQLTATPSRKGGSGRVSLVIPIGPMKTPSFRVPEIAEGMGEPRRPAPVRAGSAAPSRTTAPSRSGAPVRSTAGTKVAAAAAGSDKAGPAADSCAPDEQRLRNYAGRMVDGLGVGPGDDLRLFGPDGTPLPNLVPVMLAMSAVELGMLQADLGLIEAGVRRATERSGRRESAE